MNESTQEITVQADGKILAEQWLFGPCPWSRCEAREERRMTVLEIGQHIEYCRDMEERHNWTYREIQNMENGAYSYVLLDSHGTLYSILSLK